MSRAVASGVVVSVATFVIAGYTFARLLEPFAWSMYQCIIEDYRLVLGSYLLNHLAVLGGRSDVYHQVIHQLVRVNRIALS